MAQNNAINAPISAFGKTLIDDVDAATARATLAAQQTLSGLALTGVTAAADDLILIQDFSDGLNLKTTSGQSIIDLVSATAAPYDSKYIIQTADAGLPSAQVLSVLSTGLVKNTTTTGVLSIASSTTDYYGPGGGAQVAIADGGTAATTKAGAVSSLFSGTALTAATVASGDLVIIQDVSDSSNVKVVTAQSIADLGPGGSSAPNDATYITQTSNGSLTSEQALGSLATGIMKSTTTTGVVSIASSTTDYYGPGGGAQVAIADGGTAATTKAGALGSLISGTALTAATVASGDLVMIQDVSDSSNLKIVTAQSIADLGPGGSSAPNDAKYILQVADAGLANAQSLGVLTTGLMKSTTTTGVVSIATAGVDYFDPSAIIPIASGGTGSGTAAGARTNLGLGTIAVQDANNVSITGGSITGITDLAVADGGTGSSTASGARTNLGLVIGTDVQAYDATLSSLAGLGTAANKMVYTTGIDTWAETDITAFARTLLDDADAATARTTLGLGTMSTQASNSVSITGGTITGITDLAVADGGTGSSSFTAYAVVCGGTTSTSPLQSIASVGTTGYVLTSNGAGALPTFQAAGGGGSGTLKFWVNANGADSTVHGSSNVSSYSHSGTGINTVNFTSAFASSTWCCLCSLENSSGGGIAPMPASMATSSVVINTRSTAFNLSNSTIVYAAGIE